MREMAIGHLTGRLLNQPALVGRQQSERLIGLGCRKFDQTQRLDQCGGKTMAADGKVEDGALRTGAIQRVVWHLKITKRVAFGSHGPPPSCISVLSKNKPDRDAPTRERVGLGFVEQASRLHTHPGAGAEADVQAGAQQTGGAGFLLPDDGAGQQLHKQPRSRGCDQSHTWTGERVPVVVPVPSGDGALGRDRQSFRVPRKTESATRPGLGRILTSKAMCGE